jgi:hypothetical protein
MSIRLPSDELHYITTIPVALMALLRVVEHLEEGCSWSTVAECLLFFAAVILHVCRDVASMSPTVFFWGTTASVCFMILFSKNLRALTLVVGLPFLLVPLGLYIGMRLFRGQAVRQTLYELIQTYDDLTAPELVLTLDGSDDEENWDERL